MARKRLYRGMFLTEKIITAYPRNFCGAIITGPRGIGKSSYALNVAWEVYTNIGYNEEEAWNKTLSVCKFTMKDVIDFIEKNAKSEDKERMLIWDDTGVYASTMEWWSNRTLLKQLKSVTDTIRTGVCSLIMTTPSESGLTKFLRDYDDYIVQISYHESGGNYRNAKGYLKRTLPSGNLRIYSKFRNKFYVMIPDWIWEKYIAERERVHNLQLQEIKKVMEEQEILKEIKRDSMELKRIMLQKKIKKLKT